MSGAATQSEPLEPTGTPADSSPQGAAQWPSLLVRGLQLAGLWAIAVVWPLFDVLRNEPDFFVARGNTAGDLVLYTLIHVFVPPLVMVAIEALVDLASRAAGRIVHLVFVGGLAAVFALGFIKDVIPGLAFPSIFLSIAAGAAFAWFYWRQAAVRSVLTWLSPAPLVVIVLFLFLSPISDILFPAEGQTKPVTAKGNGTPVFLIVFDEAPAAALMDREELVNSARFPNFGALGKTATWYRNNATVADGTISGVPAILSGQRPANRPSPTRTYPQSVFTLLASSHAITNAEPMTRVCPRSICPVRVRSQETDTGSSRLLTLIKDLTVVERRVLYPPELANRLPAVDNNFEDFSGAADFSVKPGQYPEGRVQFGDNAPIAGESKSNRILARTARLASTIDKPGSRPPLYVLHMEVPHVPWRFERSGLQYPIAEDKVPGLEDDTWGSNRYLADVGLQRFLLQTQYADSILGSIVADIKKSGLWDKSLVVVTTDHGASFQTRTLRRSVVARNFAEMANTPLFVKYPGQEKGKISDAPTLSIDILPTIAKVTGVQTGWKYQGRPLDDPHPKVTDVTVRSSQKRGPFTYPYAKMLAQRRVIVDRWTSLFPGGTASLYRVGPNQELIGRSVSGLETAAGSARATISNPNLYRKILPDSGVLPYNVAGRISGLGSGKPLAVAVNGKVAAVGESYQTPTGVRFGILVPPESMTGSSSAKVTVYEVAGGRLRPLGSAGGS